MMKLTIIGNRSQFDYVARLFPQVAWTRVDEFPDYEASDESDGYFYMGPALESATFDEIQTSKPVFINAVPTTLSALTSLKNVVRINGWNGFLEHKVWEVAGTMSNDVTTILGALDKRWITVPDEPGFISARVIAMIINEAYYALTEGVSNKEAIDTAMKLGTNYPYGPFEWSEKIGVNSIYQLLIVLYTENERYKPAAALVQAALQ